MATDNNEIIPEFDDETAESLKITLEKISEVNNCVKIYLEGYIDTYNSNFFQRRVAKIIDGGFVYLIFNCSLLSYVSSTGIGAFTAFLKMVRARNGDIILMEIQPRVYEVFQLLGFAKFFTIKDSTAEAIAYFQHGAPTQSALFPKVFACPVCGKKLKAIKAGRFRCSECKSILAVSNEGQVLLG
jgi:anti-anti-sigma factor